MPFDEVSLKKKSNKGEYTILNEEFNFSEKLKTSNKNVIASKKYKKTIEY